MKIELNNLGVLRQVEFSVNDFTIICGKNNTGKTYASYALFGFLEFWRRYLPRYNLDDEIESLLSDGIARVDVSQYLQKANKFLGEGCNRYAQDLSEIFASSSNQFQEAKFRIHFKQSEISIDRPFQRVFHTSNQEKLFSINKEADCNEMIISLLIEKNLTDHFPKTVIKDFISNGINELLFKPLLPHPFIASVERTGATIFRKELNFARNRLLEEMMKSGEDIDPRELLFKSYKDYPLPVKINVDFTRNLQAAAKRSSFIAKQHPNLLQDFTEILGGEYSINKEDTIHFKPKRNSVQLEMDESSSSVRSLLDLGFYLRHIARQGDLLMIDEPELNLHPVNQCRIARLLVQLINVGIKVFITTHSDYLIKELNTLIMLNGKEPHLREIAERENYRRDEMLDPNRISVYIAKESLVLLAGNQRRSRQPTFVRAPVDKKLGIEVSSFDSTIDRMNRIHEEIIWSGEY